MIIQVTGYSKYPHKILIKNLSPLEVLYIKFFTYQSLKNSLKFMPAANPKALQSNFILKWSEQHKMNKFCSLLQSNFFKTWTSILLNYSQYMLKIFKIHIKSAQKWSDFGIYRAKRLVLFSQLALPSKGMGRGKAYRVVCSQNIIVLWVDFVFQKTSQIIGGQLF